MLVRRETTEHTFGNLKAWMGATHFKIKTLKNAGREMALHVLAYNIKRVIVILSIPVLLETIAAFLSLVFGFGATLWTPPLAKVSRALSVDPGWLLFGTIRKDGRGKPSTQAEQ